MSLRRISQPLERERILEVVTVTNLKTHARIRSGDEDDIIADYLTAAFDFLHGEHGWLRGYQILAEQFAYYPGRFDATTELPLRPFLGDPGDVLIKERTTRLGPYEEILPVDYLVTNLSDFGVVARIANRAPISTVYDAGITEIQFWAGHKTPEAVPQRLKQAIRLLATHWFQKREVTEVTKEPEVMWGLRSLAGGLRVSHDHS